MKTENLLPRSGLIKTALFTLQSRLGSSRCSLSAADAAAAAATRRPLTDDEVVFQGIEVFIF